MDQNGAQGRSEDNLQPGREKFPPQGGKEHVQSNFARQKIGATKEGVQTRKTGGGKANAGSFGGDQAKKPTKRVLQKRLRVKRGQAPAAREKKKEREER